MMKQSNKILVGCLALLLVLSVGYALFSDTITINGTATAKGDFAYEITTMKGIDTNIKTSNMYAVLNNYGMTGDSISFGSEEGVEISSITYSASVNEPGQSQYFTAKVTNTGTIPITFDMYYDFAQNSSYNADVRINDGSIINVKSSGCANVGNDLSLSDCCNLENLNYQLTELKDIYVSKDVYEELNTNFDNGIDALPIIETGESIYLLFNSFWGYNVNLNDTIVGVDMTATNTITMPVKQVTVE